MRLVHRRLLPPRSTTCARVHLAVSARADGERGPHPPALAAHLAVCAPCRRFTAACEGTTPELADLLRPLRLHPSRPAPAELLALVTRRTTSFPAPPVADAPTRRFRLCQVLSWAAAAVPASAFAVVLPVALSHAPSVVPSHIPTPCTIRLEAHRGRPAG